VKPAPFAFSRPSSLAEATELLATHPGAKVLAGGQSLVPLLSMRLASPAMLVDINGLQELSYVRADSDGVRIGALARHSDVEADAAVREVQPLIGLALRQVAHPTIRNRGTTVGSIVHADAAAEMPVVLSLLGGRVTAVSSSGSREVEAADLFVGPLESSLRPDEIAVEAFFPALAREAGVAFDEVARRQGDYALCGVAAEVVVAGADVLSVRAGYLSVSDVPTVVDLSAAFAGGAVSDASLDDSADLALAALHPADDIHASAAYRRQLVRALTCRVVRAAYEHAVERAASSAGTGAR
jgi:carbon-monoxide dehydrogenase medium subunit